MRFSDVITSIACLVMAVPAAAETDPAVDRINAYHEAVVAVMKQGGALKMSGRVEKFMPIVRSYYDMPAITALLVGPAWASTPTATKTEATEAVLRHNAVSHATNFASYDGERFTADPKTTVRGSDKLIRASILSGSSTTRLVYRMRQSGGTWKILDVYSNGVSQTGVQRSDFASAIASGGAAGLAKRLGEVDARNSK